MKVLKWFYLSSLHVALATGVCTVAFFKLPDGHKIVQWIPIVQIVLACWLIYIVDRILDVIRNQEGSLTERHKFHFENQYNMQLLAIALVVVNLALLLREPWSIILYGLIVSFIVLIYLGWIVPKHPVLKDLSMPLIYLFAVIGVSFVRAPSVHFSSWLIAVMFSFVVFQNLLAFAFFEGKSTGRWVNILGGLNLFLFILFFLGSWHYPNKLALILLTISLLYSLITSNQAKVGQNYRWLLDSLLFLPILIF